MRAGLPVFQARSLMYRNVKIFNVLHAQCSYTSNDNNLSSFQYIAQYITHSSDRLYFISSLFIHMSQILRKTGNEIFNSDVFERSEGVGRIVKTFMTVKCDIKLRHVLKDIVVKE